MKRISFADARQMITHSKTMFGFLILLELISSKQLLFASIYNLVQKFGDEQEDKFCCSRAINYTIRGKTVLRNFFSLRLLHFFSVSLGALCLSVLLCLLFCVHHMDLYIVVNVFIWIACSRQLESLH